MSYTHSRTGRAVLASLVPVICPPEAIELTDAIVHHMELSLDASPVLLQRGFTAGLLAYDLGALARYAKRAHRLLGEPAERYYAAWERGLTPVQVQLARGIRQLMGLACYEQPAMMERVGYRPGPWIAEVTQRRLTVYRDDVVRQQAQILAPDPLRPGIKRERA